MTRTFCIVALLCAASSARAGFVYACDGNDLYRIDIDAIGGPTATLLRANAGAFSIAGGNTVDELFLHDGTNMRPYTISTDTLGAPTGVAVSGIAFGEGLDGYWYIGSSSITRHVPDNTGVTPVTIPTLPDAFAGDFATSNAAVSYGAMGNGIVVIDRNTGVQTPFSSLANMWGLAFTLDGRMIAGSSTGDIFQIDPATGTPTLLGNVGVSIFDMASERGIPTPGAAALVGVAGLVGLRRRRA